MTAPSRVMFLFSCCILLSFPFLRLACADEVEDMLAVVVMLTTAPYFLFFCRGFKTVGPFVVMIYRMIMGDLLRFVCIYLVFVMGFSQGKKRTNNTQIRIISRYLGVHALYAVIREKLERQVIS